MLSGYTSVLSLGLTLTSWHQPDGMLRSLTDLALPFYLQVTILGQGTGMYFHPRIPGKKGRTVGGLGVSSIISLLI